MAESIDDLIFASATQAIAAMRSGRISAVELTELMYQRIEAVNPRINAIVVQMRDAAFARARQADDERARGRFLGPLHGLPVTIKDGFDTTGVPNTAGNAEWKNHFPVRDAPVVARLKKAGAILLGVTNVPNMLSDWQSYNDIYGQTNNPWDLTRTPGGSTGGGAAALAAGIGYLATGTDTAGSIRVPAHFCGVFGHKPTLNVVPCTGIMPTPPQAFTERRLITVCGALARSADDLTLALSVLGGPEDDDAAAYSWKLPPPRRSRLSDYRIGYLLDDKRCAVASDERQVLAESIVTLRRAGARLIEGWPAGFNSEQASQNYFFLMLAGEGQAPRSTSLEEFTAARQQQLEARKRWQEYFRGCDAFLLPAAFLPAFAHDHSEPPRARILNTVDGPRPYYDLMFWPSFASYTGHPATVAPVGLTNGGLPIGMQIIGPYLEDATSIDIAAKLQEVLGGFRVPKGI
jgi:amidase